MSKYGQVAVTAVRQTLTGKDPREAWDEAATEAYPDKLHARRKGCPKSAFLGLLSAGLVNGIVRTDRAPLSSNGQYAIELAAILRANPALIDEPKALWAFTSGCEKQSNEQVEVVRALWKQGLLFGTNS